MTRAVSQADPIARERAKLITMAVKNGYRISYGPDGKLDLIPPWQGPASPQDPFDLLDLRR